MTLDKLNLRPGGRTAPGNQPKNANDVEPPRRKQGPYKLGNFAKSLMAHAQSENSCLSPNTLQALVKVNPIMSQFGHPNLPLYSSSSSDETQKEGPASAPEPAGCSTARKSESEIKQSSQSHSRKDLAVEAGNNILNISFTGESEYKPNYYDSFNINDQSNMTERTNFGIPSHIHEATRSFAQPKTGEDLSDWSLAYGVDHDKSYDIPRRFNNESLAENEDNGNDSQDSFMLNRRKMKYNDSLDGTHQPYDKMSLIAAERSRFTSSPDQTGNMWGITRAISTPELSSKKSPVDQAELFSFAEEISELYKPSLENPFSPAFTKPVGIGFQNQSMKISTEENKNTITDKYLPYPSSGYVLSSRQNTIHHQPKKLSKVEEGVLGTTYSIQSSYQPINQPQPRQFGRCIEADEDAKELSREFQKNQGSNFTFNKPTPLKQLYIGKSDNTPKNSINRENNPEVAARISTTGTGRGSGGDAKKEGRSHISNTPTVGRQLKGLGNIPSSSGKHKPSSKEKKPSTGSGWKFSSEHVEDKEYLIIKQLGKGGCGEVHLVIEKDTRQLFALKKVSLAGINEASVQECLNEVQMLVDLKDSDLVVHIYAWEFDNSEKTMKIVMEHGQCDLNFSIRTVNSTALKLKSIWERILMIVHVIHQRGIVHADLKPANFIWAGDNLKIIDFGIASRLQQDHTSIAMLCPKGTLNFISPETIQPDALGQAKIGPKSDIWSLGCILYLMVFGRTPFEHITHPISKMNAIVKGDIPFPHLPPQLQSSASELLSVLKSCFQIDYKMRPTAADLLQHPFLKRP